jgi:hypothetical protein
MARKAWIGTLGFGLFLFVSLDVGLIWYLVSSKSGARGYGSLLIPIFVTWQAYLALRKRIDSAPEERTVNRQQEIEEGTKTSWQPKL